MISFLIQCSMKILAHDSARGTESLGGEVGSELGLDSTRVTVRSRDSAPDDSDSATVDLPLGLVDVGDTLDNKSVIFSNGDAVTTGTVWYTTLFPRQHLSPYSISSALRLSLFSHLPYMIPNPSRSYPILSSQHHTVHSLKNRLPFPSSA